MPIVYLFVVWRTRRLFLGFSVPDIGGRVGWGIGWGWGWGWGEIKWWFWTGVVR